MLWLIETSPDVWTVVHEATARVTASAKINFFEIITLSYVNDIGVAELINLGSFKAPEEGQARAKPMTIV